MLSTLSAIIVLVNYTLGVGFLLIPWAYNNAGLTISLVVTVVSLVISNFLAAMMVEQISRAECKSKLLE